MRCPKMDILEAWPQESIDEVAMRRIKGDPSQDSGRQEVATEQHRIRRVFLDGLPELLVSLSPPVKVGCKQAGRHKPQPPVAMRRDSPRRSRTEIVPPAELPVAGVVQYDEQDVGRVSLLFQLGVRNPTPDALGN